MELIQVGSKTYYIKNRTNIGVYLINEFEVFIIDSGNDEHCGKKIIKTIAENNWQIKGIINTHSHADHIGGNKVIQERCNAPIYAHEIDACFTNYPILEPSVLYGAAPLAKLKNKLVMAEASNTQEIDNNLPNGLEYFNEPGHSLSMIGIKTSDNVYFLGDALINEDTINKYHLFYLFDVEEYLKTLDYLETLEGLFIISHGDATHDIKPLIKLNRDTINEICDLIYNICKSNKTLEEIVQEVFEHYDLAMSLNQYILNTDIIKAYLTYLQAQGKIDYTFINNKMYWFAKENLE